MIGGNISKEKIGISLIQSYPKDLEEHEFDILWKLLNDIITSYNFSLEPEEIYGQWIEFIKLKSNHTNSYYEEYKSAIAVLAELEDLYAKDAINKLIFENNINPEEDKDTRLYHCKSFVIDEFIKLILVSGGFRDFEVKNTNGYIYKSRF